MRKKVRNSLILIVVLVVILGLNLGIWKMFFVPEPPQPLKIKDLEDAHITTTRSSEEYGWIYKFCDYDRRVFFSSNSLFDNQNIFHDRSSSREALALCIVAFPTEAEQMTVPAGDSIKITYDGGQKLVIYLPKMNVPVEEKDVYLYVASDGSTYYDEALTQLACPSDLVKPLKIKDLEKAITTVRTAGSHGYPAEDPIWEILFRAISGKEFGKLELDNNNEYWIDYGDTYDPASVTIRFDAAYSEDLLKWSAGEAISITYDGGQILKIYLPAMDGERGVALYISEDGSTYYDKWLTQPAQLAPTEEKI